jgi:hypothetical protein
VRTFKKEWVPFLEGACFGEASADYLVGCMKVEKVVLFCFDLAHTVRPAMPPDPKKITAGRPRGHKEAIIKLHILYGLGTL